MYYRYETIQRRILVEEEPAKAHVDTPKEVASFLFDVVHLDERLQENFVVLLLNVKCEITGYETVSYGGLAEASAHPREVFRPPIVAGAYAIIVAHNHPSGDPTPSAADINTTRILKDAGKILGIQLLDHIIVGEYGKYTSMKEAGLAGLNDN